MTMYVIRSLYLSFTLIRTSRQFLACVSLNLHLISMVPRSLTLTLSSNHFSLRSSFVPRFVLSLVSHFLHTGTFLVLDSFLARPSCSCISLVSYFTLPVVVPCSYLARSLSYLASSLPYLARSLSYLARSFSYLASSLSYLDRTSFVSRS